MQHVASSTLTVRKISTFPAAVFTAIAATAMLVTLSYPLTPALAAPPDQVSNNYAGYEAINGTYTHALTTIRVPQSNCALSSAESAVGYWLGLGGSSGSLEQAGVTTHCVNGIPTYGAFYEIIPGDGPHVLPALPYVVFTGDFIDVEINFVAPNTFDITITGPLWSFSTSQQQSNMNDALSSADFITEAPGNPSLPLTNFGTAHFQNSWANHTLLTDLTDNVQKWVMLDQQQQPKATPTPLTPYGGGGPSFDVNWVSTGP
jgi:hypothetical protein